MVLTFYWSLDLGSRKAASSATGFIAAMRYVGASLTGIATGYLVENFGWDADFYYWIFAAIMMVLIWNYKDEKVEYE